VYWILALEHGLETCPQIAKASGVCPKTVWSALKGKPIIKKTRLKLAKAVGLADDRKILRRGGSHKADGAIGPETLTTVLDATAIQKRKFQDVKLVLHAPRLSKALISGKSMPSFAECMRQSNVWTPVDDRHKDYPFLRGSTFNHFVQLALVVTLDLIGEPKLICYRRMPRPQVPSQVHTVGPSILFGCSSWAHVDRYKHQKSPLDMWLDTVEDSNEAEMALLGGERPILLQLAERKIDLLPHRRRITPFGIITRDERKESFKRVYTQFVFHVVLSVTTKDVDRFVRLIPAHGAQLSRLPEKIDPVSVFAGDKGRLNTMDIVAWKALHCDDLVVQFGSARFCRGFAIV
jgi:hypothetical protein